MANLFNEPFTNLDAWTYSGSTALATGKTGNGVLVPASSTLNIAASSRILPLIGTVDFWFQPQWDGNALGAGKGNKTLFYVQFTASPQYYIHIVLYPNPYQSAIDTKVPAYYLKFEFKYGSTYQRNYNSTAPIAAWKTGEWHRVTLFWDFTLAAGSQYIMSRVDDYYGPTAHLALTGPTSDLIDGGALIKLGQGANTLTENAEGVFDSLLIDNTSLLPVVPFPVEVIGGAGYNPSTWVPSTFDPWRTLKSGDGFCSIDETNATEAADCALLGAGLNPTKDVMFFEKPNFTWVFPGYVPAESELRSTALASSTISRKVAKGEHAHIFFNIYTRIALTGCELAFGDFTGAGTIAAALADLRLVHNWWQYGPSFVPELLVQDDRVALEQVTSAMDPTHYHVGDNYFIPSMPDHENHAHTAMAVATSKQAVMIVKVPADAAAGIYNCTVTLTADGGISETLTLQLDVQNFSLVQDNTRRAINYMTGNPDLMWVDLTGLGDGITGKMIAIDEATWEARIRAELQDIRDHGFNDLVCFGGYTIFKDANHSYTEILIDAAADVGFQRFIPYIATPYTAPLPDPVISAESIARFTWVRDLLIARGFPPIFWGIDEFGQTEQKVPGAVAKQAMLESLGCKMMMSAAPADKAYMDANYPDCVIDYWMIPLSADTGNSPQGQPVEKASLPTVETTYWWQLERSDPRSNRLFSGFNLYISGADGIDGHNYGSTQSMAYNEFRTVANQYLVYNSEEGFLPTLEWEALRAGSNDHRLLLTWKYYYDRVVVSRPSEAAASLAAVEAVLENYKYAGTYMHEAQMPFTMTQFETDRGLIIDQIVALKALDPTYRRSVISGVISAMWKRFRKIGGVRQ